VRADVISQIRTAAEAAAAAAVASSCAAQHSHPAINTLANYNKRNQDQKHRSLGCSHIQQAEAAIADSSYRPTFSILQLAADDKHVEITPIAPDLRYVSQRTAGEASKT
jgi:hypothetical protein